MTSMQDVIGRDLKIDDPVVFRHPRQKSMQTGRIVGFSKRKVRINWISGGFSFTYLAWSEDVVLLPAEDYALYALTKD